MITNSDLNARVHSAQVELQLQAAGQTYGVCAVEPDCFVLAEARVFDAIDAELLITVDGRLRRCPIRLQAAATPVRTIFYTRR